MSTKILRYPLLSLTLAALGASTVSADHDEDEFFYFAGVDTAGLARAQSNDDGTVMFESPEFPRGLWIHLGGETGDALSGIKVFYRGQADGLVAVICYGPGVQMTEVWTRPDGTPLRLALKPEEAAGDLPGGLYSLDWRTDPTAESLLEPEETQLTGWDHLRDFLRKHSPVYVKTIISTLAIGGDVDTLVDYLKETHRLSEPSMEGEPPIYAQVFPQVVTRVDYGQRGFYFSTNVSLYIPLLDDANLARLVRKQLGPILGGDLASVENLEEIHRDVFSLEGIQHLSGLRYLRLNSFQGNDLGPLANLTSLTHLTLGQGQLRGGQIEDVTPLGNLTNIEYLKLYRNKISDIRPLGRLTNLDLLNLTNNQISDLEPLASLANLRWLGMEDNKISDVGVLGKLTNLSAIFLGENQIKDISSLENLIGLSWIGLSNNQIEDISPLVANPGMGKADKVELRNNPLNNQALTEHIPALRARGVEVYY